MCFVFGSGWKWQSLTEHKVSCKARRRQLLTYSLRSSRLKSPQSDFAVLKKIVQDGCGRTDVTIRFHIWKKRRSFMSVNFNKDIDVLGLRWHHRTLKTDPLVGAKGLPDSTDDRLQIHVVSLGESLQKSLICHSDCCTWVEWTNGRWLPLEKTSRVKIKQLNYRVSPGRIKIPPDVRSLDVPQAFWHVSSSTKRF